ncbi:MAG: hypothetical protein NDI94_06600, partial [Candidatus Woesearchaeota archaeon]|nr:hypothetical protein [Candidatus Woesearchaeota archaeon]
RMYGHSMEEVDGKKDITEKDLRAYDAIVIDDKVGDVEFSGLDETLRQVIGEKIIFTALGPDYISAEREGRYIAQGVKRFIVKNNGEGMPVPESCQGTASNMLMQKTSPNRPEYCVNIIYCLRDMLKTDR